MLHRNNFCYLADSTSSFKGCSMWVSHWPQWEQTERDLLLTAIVIFHQYNLEYNLASCSKINDSRGISSWHKPRVPVAMVEYGCESEVIPPHNTQKEQKLKKKKENKQTIVQHIKARELNSNSKSTRHIFQKTFLSLPVEHALIPAGLFTLPQISQPPRKASPISS